MGAAPPAGEQPGDGQATATEAPPETAPPAGTDDATPAATDAGTETAGEGGELILAVEQWPECLNPVTSCANSTWMIWSVVTHLLPSLMELDPGNAYRPSPTLLEEPSIENGGLAVADDGTFTVAYRLNPDAVWSDGTPFTSADVRFTWRANLDTDGTLNTIGYELITDVDTSDPHTAVVTFGELYAPWRDLFGLVLPAHALGPDTNIAGAWNDHIPISAGPWVQQSWSQDQHVLVPNELYWVPERRPLVDRVVMVPREDTDSEIVALQTGEVMAAFPQPFPGAVQRLTGELTFVGGGGTYLEGLWINQNAPDRRFEITGNVRRAVAYSLDRQLIAEVALGSIIDDPQVLQCAGWNPTFGDWCNDDFAGYTQNLDKVTELLTAEGWSRPDPDGLWVNPDGEELVLQWNTVAGNKRREDVQALVSEMTAPFGIGWEIINYDAGELFQNRLPVMNFGTGGAVRQQHVTRSVRAAAVRHRRHPDRGQRVHRPELHRLRQRGGQRPGRGHRSGGGRCGPAGAGARTRGDPGRGRALDPAVPAALPAGLEQLARGGSRRLRLQRLRRLQGHLRLARHRLRRRAERRPAVARTGAGRGTGGEAEVT